MERIDRYFEGAAWKYLSAVDAEPDRSNQHELGGLPRAGFTEILGDPGKDTIRLPGRFIYLNDTEDESISVEGTVSWYDSRRHQPHRSPELRLYYETNDVTENLRQGLFLLVAKTRAGELLLVFAEPESSPERQLRWLFGLEGNGGQLHSVDIAGLADRPSWAASWILSELGVESELPEEQWLEEMLDRFGRAFPPTKIFSGFAREVATDIDPVSDADNTLVQLVDTEERLFRLFERHLVEERLETRFTGVDDFLKFSLSVQNRRKSRVGHALEHHLAFIFDANDIRYARGATTENRSKPDFLFPSEAAYQDPGISVEYLTMLGAKSTCKDRWRQVLSEAARLPKKHLATLQPGISSNQLDEMQANQLQLVVPEPLHQSYNPSDVSRLWSVERFLMHVKRNERTSKKK